MNRRDFLRAAGVAIALPAFETWARPGAAKKHRLVTMCAPLGLHPAYFWPEGAGADYKPSEYLEVLKEFRSQTTVVQGMAHPGMSPGFAHQASASFLTGAPGAGRPGFKNSISVDQLAAEHVGDQTRFRSLVLSGEGAGMSWTRTGALVPADNVPSKLFAKLFLADSPEEIKKREQQLAEGRSALDDVSGQAKKLGTSLGADDREKLEEYLTSVRELEKRLAKDELWFRRPKPKVDAPPPRDISNVADVLGRMKNLLDLTALALQTDSTRLVTIMMAGSTLAPPIEGVKLGYHDLSHHGKDPGKLAQLKIVEVETMKLLRDFFGRLKASKEDGATLLDLTTVFLGSNLGDGSSHSIKNLPALVVGGGFKHGRHLQPPEGTPLCNLYLSFLQRLGVPGASFGTSTGPLKGFDLL
jgi:hypothetical protein